MDEPAGAVDWSVGRYERTAAALAPAAAVLVAAAGLRPGERVVDVGCGTGNVALLAAAAGTRVVAVDPAPRLLDVTREEARRRGLDVTCERGVASSLPVPDGSCDCLLSGFGVIFSPDAEATAGEVARVLAGGGRLLLTAWLPGGALGALAMTAERLVRAATGAPPPSPGFAWHDPTSLGELFAPHDMATSVDGPHELVFSAGSRRSTSTQSSSTTRSPGRGSGRCASAGAPTRRTPRCCRCSGTTTRAATPSGAPAATSW